MIRSTAAVQRPPRWEFRVPREHATPSTAGVATLPSYADRVDGAEVELRHACRAVDDSHGIS